MKRSTCLLLILTACYHICLAQKTGFGHAADIPQQPRVPAVLSQQPSPTNQKPSPITLSVPGRLRNTRNKFSASALRHLPVVLGQGGLQLSITNIQPSCGYANGLLIVRGQGGTPPYQFSYDNGAFEPNDTYSIYDMSGGPVQHTVTVQDATGATATTTVTDDNTIPPVSLDFLAFTVAGCTPATRYNGSFTLEPSSAFPGVGPYSYSMDDVNWQSSPLFSGLTNGDYVFYIRDANGCVGSRNYTVDNCLNLSVVDKVIPTCGLSNGEVLFTASSFNGYDPMLYSSDGVTYQASGLITNLPAGNHIYYFKDSQGNVFVYSHILLTDCGFGYSATTTDEVCGQTNGSATMNIMGGFGPFQYSIDGVNWQSSPTFTNLQSGSYIILFKEPSLDIIYSQDVVIGGGCPSVTAQVTNEICGAGNGSITATASGGTAPYQYSIDGVHWQAGPVFTNLSAGNYTVSIKDKSNFPATTTVTIASVGCVSASALGTSAFCGGMNGTITVTASGGTPPYTYSLDGTIFQASNEFSGLAPGPYDVTVKDAVNTKADAPIVVNGVAGPQLTWSAQAATCVNNNGSILATGQGGTTPYQYALDAGDYSTGNTFPGLATGRYQVFVMDGNGCGDVQIATVPLVNDLTVSAGTVAPACQGVPVTLQATSNGVNFSWQPVAGLNDASLQAPNAAPDATTTYTVTATLGVCQQTSSVDLVIYPAPVPDAGPDVTVCYGKTAQLQGSGGLGFSWQPAVGLDNPAIADPVATDPAGSYTYQLSVTDAKGCRSLQPGTMVVTVTPPPQLQLNNDTAVLAGQPVQLDVLDVNGSGFTQYSWSPGIGLSNTIIRNPVATPAESTTYMVTASTDAGCAGTGSVTVNVYSVSGIFVASAFSPNGDGHNDVLRARPVGIRAFKYFMVYSRYGQRVFQTTHPDMGWDGTVNGTIQPSGTFVWLAAGVDYSGKLVEVKGTVILVR